MFMSKREVELLSLAIKKLKGETCIPAPYSLDEVDAYINMMQQEHSLWAYSPAEIIAFFERHLAKWKKANSSQEEHLLAFFAPLPAEKPKTVFRDTDPYRAIRELLAKPELKGTLLELQMAIYKDERIKRICPDKDSAWIITNIIQFCIGQFMAENREQSWDAANQDEQWKKGN